MRNQFLTLPKPKQLTFNSHIDKAINTAKRVLCMSKRAFKYLDQSAMLTIYKALIRPHLEYGNIIWSPKLKKHSIAIDKIQRRMSKITPGLKNILSRKIKVFKPPITQA